MITTVNFKNLTSADFLNAIADKSTAEIVDVRTASEFSSGHIPGAQNMDVTSEEFLDGIRGLDKSKTYYVYCRSGGRSAHACTIMTQQGFKVYNLIGGISNWQGQVVTR